MRSLINVLGSMPFCQDRKLTSAENSANIWCESAGCSLNSIALIACVAVAVIGCLAISGVMGGSNLGWITVGLGGGTVVFGSISTCFTRQKIGLIGVLSIYFIVIGMLGGFGVISPGNLGWAIIAPSMLLMGCVISASCYGTSSAIVGLSRTKKAKDKIVQLFSENTKPSQEPSHQSDLYPLVGDE